MPRYFFHIRNRSGAIQTDEVGSTFADEEAAVLDALRIVREAAIGRARAWHGCVFEIHDTDGWLVATVPVREG